MPAENATPFMRWPSASPTGSSRFRPTPVESSRRACPWSCPAIFPGVRPDAPDAVFLPTLKIKRILHPASIPTRSSFLAFHNRSQISGVLDGKMALYGIAGIPLRRLIPDIDYLLGCHRGGRVATSYHWWQPSLPDSSFRCHDPCRVDEDDRKPRRMLCALRYDVRSTA